MVSEPVEDFVQTIILPLSVIQPQFLGRLVRNLVTISIELPWLQEMREYKKYTY